MSYVIDVYRGDVESQKSYLDVLLYISFFPQLIAGPIVKYHDIQAQIRDRHADVREIASGFRRFTVGLGKKVLISNTMALAADGIFSAGAGSLNAPGAWLGAFAYMMQIYYDFSGYSDMAIGLGHMFGFTFLENFEYPYISKNIREFWRRWHISLSTWFKEYLYIPLGGNRKGKARTCVNKIIVFSVPGSGTARTGLLSSGARSTGCSFFWRKCFRSGNSRRYWTCVRPDRRLCRLRDLSGGYDP